MVSPLSYLLIIQKSGLPVYAQSFEFPDDEACKSFNEILKPQSADARSHLMGGYFSSMRLFADEMVEDKLNLLELGFNKFEILGLVKQDIFFIGIFQNFPGEEKQRNVQMEFLDGIASVFIKQYSVKEIQNSRVSTEKFADFSEVLHEISNDVINVKHCRNCLTECTVENRGCLPHSFYFNKVQFSDDIIHLKLRT